VVAVLADTHMIFESDASPVARPLRPTSAPHRLDPSVYRRRRLLVAGVALVLLGLLVPPMSAVLATVQSALAGTGGGPLTTTGAAAGISTASETVWVVRPGDTLWTIARRVEPQRDPRAVVDQLANELHGTSLYPGEQIPLPSR
jgi:nucleoid-associated protein YgaU